MTGEKSYTHLVKYRWLTVFILGLTLSVIALSAAAAQPGALQTTTFINVGEGDSAMIQDGFGFDVLIDGGTTTAGPSVVTYLHNQGVSELDVMVASHADADHIGGLINVLNDSSITVKEVLYNGYPGTTDTWNNFVTAVTAKGLTLTPLQFPADLTWGMLQAHVLNPVPGLVNPTNNESSIVIRLDYGTVNYLFTGDIDATVEATVVARQTPVASEILKVAHHGSAYSSSAPFLAAVQPTVSAISVGPNNYGHPSQWSIDRLTAVGSQVYRTDLYGNITIYSDGAAFDLVPLPAGGIIIYLPVVMSAGP